MEKMAFAVIVVLWLAWLASSGKLVDFISLAMPKGAENKGRGAVKGMPPRRF